MSFKGDVQVKFDPSFCGRVRKERLVTPRTAWEYNYLICYMFKRDFRHKPRAEKLSELKRISKIVIDGNKSSYETRRKKKHYGKRLCFVCKAPSSCQQHIVLLKNGGFDNGINRIHVCSGCHADIHPWLRKEWEI